MKDQHEKIAGYRDLTQPEIDLINRIKDMGNNLESLLLDVKHHIESQYTAASTENNQTEVNRLDKAEALSWADRAKEKYQLASMELVRSVAQPTTFC